MSKKASSILIVDDDRKILTVLQSALAQDGYTIYTAESGEEALEQIVQYPIDLLVLDMMLPGISGLEVCKWVREHISSHLPIILISGAGNEANKVKALSLDANDFVTKPFDISILQARVTAFLGKHQPIGSVFTVGPLTVDFLEQRVQVNGYEVQLEPTEYQILKILIEHKDRLVILDTLIHKLWLGEDDLDSDVEVGMPDRREQEIATCIHNLRRKIERPAQCRFIITHHHMGYRFRTGNESQVHKH